MKLKHFVLVVFAVLLGAQGALAQDAKLRPGDKIEVRLGGVPPEEISQVTGAYMIDGEGFVNLPHIGRIKASGLTMGQLQQTIEGAYKGQQIYTNPSITIAISGDSARFVNLGGAVRSPGRIPYTADLTVLTAINAAGGFTEFANQSKVRLLRDGKVQMIDIKAVRRDPSLDLPLKPGDTIEVMQSIW